MQFKELILKKRLGMRVVKMRP